MMTENTNKKLQLGKKNLSLLMIVLAGVLLLVLGITGVLLLRGIGSSSRLVEVKPITLGNGHGGETTVYFRDANHDELFLSTTGNRSDLWDSCDNIAIFYKPIYFRTSGDTLYIMAEKPDCFHPELTDANIVYQWREGNPLCYEKQARQDGYKIIHSLSTIDDYNQKVAD